MNIIDEYFINEWIKHQEETLDYEYIGRVELLASNDPKFKYLLGGVWQNAMSDEVWSRVKQLAEPWV